MVQNSKYEYTVFVWDQAFEPKQNLLTVCYDVGHFITNLSLLNDVYKCALVHGLSAIMNWIQRQDLVPYKLLLVLKHLIEYQKNEYWIS